MLGSKKGDGILSIRMVLLGIFINHSSIFFSTRFSELPQLMQPTPWTLKLVKKDPTDKYYFENSFVAVSLGLYSGFCLVSALGR